VVSAASERRPSDPSCVFCRIVAGELPSTVVRQDDRLVAIRDIAPRAPTHILILTREHIPSAADLTATDGELLGDVFDMAAELARDEGIADRGYRVVTNVGEWGGQTVDHLHFHLMGGRSFSWPPG
jgi:histidine triad (HIT) family protein